MLSDGRNNKELRIFSNCLCRMRLGSEGSVESGSDKEKNQVTCGENPASNLIFLLEDSNMRWNLFDFGIIEAASAQYNEGRTP